MWTEGLANSTTTKPLFERLKAYEESHKLRRLEDLYEHFFYLRATSVQAFWASREVSQAPEPLVMNRFYSGHKGRTSHQGHKLDIYLCKSETILSPTFGNQGPAAGELANTRIDIVLVDSSQENFREAWFCGTKVNKKGYAHREESREVHPFFEELKQPPRTVSIGRQLSPQAKAELDFMKSRLKIYDENHTDQKTIESLDKANHLAYDMGLRTPKSTTTFLLEHGPQINTETFLSGRYVMN